MSKKTSIFTIIVGGAGALLALYMISIYFSTKSLTQNIIDRNTGESVSDVLDNVLRNNESSSTSTGDVDTDGEIDESSTSDVADSTSRRAKLTEVIKSLVTDETLPSEIDRSDILGGGVGVDGIPAITDPLFVSAAQSPEWLNLEGDGLLIEREENGSHVSRFYPYQVMVSHEIVHDVFVGEKLLITYCPLCFTGVVYDLSDTEFDEFGVSGYLWESNLLMYNRPSGEPSLDNVSLWSQALGTAVVGTQTGEKLPIARFDITTFEKFVQGYPEGEVLVGEKVESGERARFYDRVPYGGDLRNIEPIFSFSGEGDTQLPKNEIILGLAVNDARRAYPTEQLITELTEKGAGAVIDDEVDGVQIQITYDDETGVLAFTESASKERLTPIPSFWISWVSVNPQTTIYAESN